MSVYRTIGPLVCHTDRYSLEFIIIAFDFCNPKVSENNEDVKDNYGILS